MRLFENLEEAESEIRRDLAKGTPVLSTRVQQRTGLNLQSRERLGYEYSILHFPDLTPEELVEFGRRVGMKLYLQYPNEIHNWLVTEAAARKNPRVSLGIESNEFRVTENLHPALKTTFEGNHPSYTYSERMLGAVEMLSRDIRFDPDTRRAFWPIFHPMDAIRSAEATRIPCSLGYQAMVRKLDQREVLMLFYLERSCDFDTFWLSDLWLAHQFQKAVAESSGYQVGQLIHYVISLHSFAVEDQEIY